MNPAAMRIFSNAAMNDNRAIFQTALRIDLKDVPTCLDVERLCLKCPNKRAPGLDGIPVEVVKEVLPHFSVHLHNLFFKSWILGAEPLQAKGGFICTIQKKANDLTAAGMRGIMLLNVVGKLYHAVARLYLMKWVAPRRMPAQHGGFAGHQPAFATLTLRSFCQLAHTKQVSTGVIFIDVRNAFHCMLRSHVFGDASTWPPVLTQLLAQEGLDPDHLQQIAAAHSARFTADAPLSLQRVLQDAHLSTWYTLPDRQTCSSTSRGSRPGSPLADLAFNLLVNSMMDQIQQVLWKHPRVLQASQYLMLQPPVVAWVDDLAIPVPVLEAAQLDSTISELLEAVRQICQDFGLRLNFKAGKTEAILQYRGANAQQLRRDRFVQEFCQIRINHETSVRCVSTYEHLGTTFAQGLSITHEVNHRLGKATAAFRSLRKLFTNRHIPCKVRLTLLDSLILPVLLYGAGSWPLLPARLYAKVNHAVLTWQRCITRDAFWAGTHHSDVEFLAIWKLPALSVRLCKLRLLFALQLHNKAPASTMDFATCVGFSSQSWFDALRHNLEWLFEQAPDHPLAAPEVSADCIMQWMMRPMGPEASLIRRTIRKYIQQEHMIWMIAQDHRLLRGICERAGVKFAQAESFSAHHLDARFACDICTRVFTTPQGLNAHRWQQHQECSIERRYVFGPTCPACNRCFWTSQRMQQHLKYSRHYGDQGCLAWLVQHCDPLPEPLPVEVPDHLRNIHRLPWTSAEGPSNVATSTAWERHRLQQWDELNDRWSARGLPADIPPKFAAKIGQRLNEATTHWIAAAVDDMHELTFAWLSILDEQFHASDYCGVCAQVSFYMWGQTQMYSLFDGIEDPTLMCTAEKVFLDTAAMDDLYEMWSYRERLLHAVPPPLPGLPPALGAPDQRARHPLEPIPDTLGQQLALLSSIIPDVTTWKLQRGVPLVQLADGSLGMIILHLFSGRRRTHDCHDWAHELMPSYFPDVKPLVLSLDTAVHETDCDLAHGDSAAHILRLCECRMVALVLSGPPCETWTAARHLAPPEGHRGRWPRPLRSRALPWGIRGRTARELRQAQTGSELMLRSMMIELCAVLQGGASGREHPAHPWNQEYVTVWATDVHRKLFADLPGAQELRVEQWRYGAPSVKPTVLSWAGLPPIARVLYSCYRDDVQRPQQTLGGLNDQGDWRTSAAKEYPADMCKALVKTALSGLRTRACLEGRHLATFEDLSAAEKEWFERTLAHGKCCFATTFRADYQPVQ